MDTEWENLGFEFRPTNSHVKIMYKDGEWSKPELVKVRLCYTFIKKSFKLSVVIMSCMVNYLTGASHRPIDVAAAILFFFFFFFSI